MPLQHRRRTHRRQRAYRVDVATGDSAPSDAMTKTRRTITSATSTHRFVECNVPVAANAQELDVDASIASNLGLPQRAHKNGSLDRLRSTPNRFRATVADVPRTTRRNYGP